MWPVFLLDFFDQPLDTTDHYKEDQDNGLTGDVHEMGWWDRLVLFAIGTFTGDGVTHLGIGIDVLVFDVIHDT